MVYGAPGCGYRLWCFSLRLLILFALLLGLASCRSDGESGQLPSPSTRNPPLERQAIVNLVELYRQAVMQEDIDRLQDLLLPAAPESAVEASSASSINTVIGDFATAAAFRRAMAQMFRTHTVTALHIPADTVQVADNRRSVTFQELESVIDLTAQEQITSLLHTTFTLQIAQQSNVTTIRIIAVQRTGPLVRISTPGQVITAIPARLFVEAPTAELDIARVEVTVPETDEQQELTAYNARFLGVFTPPPQATPQPLRLEITEQRGQRLLVTHAYRVQGQNAAVVSRILPPTQGELVVPPDLPVFAVVEEPDGAAVWFGGDSVAGDAQSSVAGTLFRVTLDGNVRVSVALTIEEEEPSFPDGAVAHIEDLAFDDQGRLHAVFLQSPDVTQPDAIVRSGIHTVLHAEQIEAPGTEVICQTVNSFAANYPLTVPRLQSRRQVASPGARVVGAGNGQVWLFASDGGVAQVRDNVRTAPCPEPVEVQYDPVFRRQSTQGTNDLLTNSVPAFVPAADGALWFGTALGITRWQDGTFTPLPFSRAITLRDNVATLETFFQAIAAAIFAARPLTTVALGNVSFQEEFSQPLVKEDLIFSALEDRQQRLWVGTLGGGIRRIEASSTGFQDTLHFTRLGVTRRDPQSGERSTISAQGLNSNIIFALAEAPDGSLWAATDEGVSHIQDEAGNLTISHFSTLDGLALPVRDVAVSRDGTGWLATAGGMFRLEARAGVVQGRLLDPQNRPVVGADLRIAGTAIHTVSDVDGRFTLTRVAAGEAELHIDGELATGGPFLALTRPITVRTGTQDLGTLGLVPRAPAVPFDPVAGGDLAFPGTPEAILHIPANAAEVPAGTTVELHLTLLPLTSLPHPLAAGQTPVAAADLQATNLLTLQQAIRLTLPNQGGLPPGQIVELLQFSPGAEEYAHAGYGRVSADGTVITTLQSEVMRLEPVVFAVTAATQAIQFLIASGNEQIGTVTTPLPEPVHLQVQDGNARGIPGVALAARIVQGGGHLSASSLLTDATGSAQVSWTLGPQAGEQSVEITSPGIPGSPLRATATALPDAPFTLELLSGAGQTAVVATALPIPLRVALRDRAGNPLAGTEVTFATPEGGLRPVDADVPVESTLSVLTDARGEAVATAVLGERAGAYRFTATVAGLPPVIFSAIAQPGAVEQLIAVEGNGAEVTVNNPLSLVALVADRFNNAIGNVPMTFRVRDAAQGTVSPGQTESDAEGRASTTLIPLQPGDITVVARAARRTVEFRITARPDTTALRLVRVGGNTQSGRPGQVLPAPLVVRLENQFGVPVVGAPITLFLRRGAGTFLSAPNPGVTRRTRQQERLCPLEEGPDGEVIARTDENGEACSYLRIESEEEDIVAEAMARNRPEVAPVRFLAIVGSLDTPDIPLDVVVNSTGDRLFVADRRRGVQAIDVSNPTLPRLINNLDADGTEVRLALATDPDLGELLYVGTNFPPRIYILDSERRVRGRRQFTDSALERHGITGLVVQDGQAYIATDARTEEGGTLHIVQVSPPSFGCPDILIGTSLPGRPRGLAVASGFAYVPAGRAGLLIFDVSDPSVPPVALPPLAGTFFSEMTLANGMGYVIETRRNTDTGQEQHLVTILDLRNPAVPQRRGTVAVPMVTQVAEVPPVLAVDEHFAYVAQFALGLQAIDIRQSDAPRLVGRVDTPSQALSVALHRGANSSLLYVSDQIFGVQVIRGPGVDLTDSDGDGVIDFFDAFPSDPLETQDSDGDGRGDRADLDDDNDTFPDAEERLASPPTDPVDPQSFPLTAPPEGSTMLTVDANGVDSFRNPLPPRQRNGTPEAPYRSLTEALRVVREGRAPQVDTIQVRPGVYAPLTTQERFPLDLSAILMLEIRKSTEPENAPGQVILDAAFSGDVMVRDTTEAAPGTPGPITLTELTLTHGAHGLIVRALPESTSAAVLVRDTHLVENIFSGLSIQGNAHEETRMERSFVMRNGQEGIGIFERSRADLRGNTIEGNGEVGILVGIDAIADIQDNPSIMGNGHDGIRVVDRAVATIRGNTIRGNGSFGIETQGSCNPIGSGIFVSDATATITANMAISGNRLDGVALEQDATAVVTGNTIEENGLESRSNGHGIRIGRNRGDIQRPLNEIIIDQNTIQNSCHGIFVQNTVVSLSLINNDISRTPAINCSGSINDGIRVENSSDMLSMTIEGNQIVGYHNGISASSVIWQGLLRIINNHIRASINEGIELLDHINTFIAQNRVVSNGGIGIRLRGSLEDSIARIVDNVITDNSQEGLQLSQIFGDVTITANRIERNGSFSNVLLSGSSALLQDNLIRTHLQGDGVRISCATGSTVITISGGEITENAAHGIVLGRLLGQEPDSCPDSTPALAILACSGEPMTIARNGGFGILVEAGTAIQLADEQVMLDNNAAGDITGAGQIGVCVE